MAGHPDIGFSGNPSMEMIAPKQFMTNKNAPK
jgi:hypothetical protein